MSDIETHVAGCLRTYYAEHGVMPSYSTLARLAGVKAKSWAHAVVERLRAQGVVAITPDRRLKPGPRFDARKDKP